MAFDAIGGKAIDDLAEVADDGGTIVNFGSLGSNMGTNIYSLAANNVALKSASIISWFVSHERSQDLRTAIDTNVLSALCSKESVASEIASNLGNAKTEGGLVVGAPIYVELLTYPKATESFVNGVLADTGIDVDFGFQQSLWLEAGRRFASMLSGGERLHTTVRDACLQISSWERTP